MFNVQKIPVSLLKHPSKLLAFCSLIFSKIKFRISGPRTSVASRDFRSEQFCCRLHDGILQSFRRLSYVFSSTLSSRVCLECTFYLLSLVDSVFSSVKL